MVKQGSYGESRACGEFQTGGVIALGWSAHDLFSGRKIEDLADGGPCGGRCWCSVS